MENKCGDCSFVVEMIADSGAYSTCPAGYQCHLNPPTQGILGNWKYPQVGKESRACRFFEKKENKDV